MESLNTERGLRCGVVMSIVMEIRRLSKVGQIKEAVSLLNVMNKDGIYAGAEDYGCILEGCITLKDLDSGMQLHHCIAENGLKLTVVLQNALLNMYCKCGDMADAENLFDAIHNDDVFTWTTMISGYATHGPSENAFKMLTKMEDENVKPDAVTFLSAIKACAKFKSLDHGKRLHVMILENGFANNIPIRSSLVDMYAKCGGIECARREFQDMQSKDAVSWNAMICGYVQNGHFLDAFLLFSNMMVEGVNPNRITVSSVLKACAHSNMNFYGQQIYEYIIERKFDTDAFLCSSIVDMYLKCGSIKDAWNVFNKMPLQPVACWNAMIIGCAHLGNAEDSLKLFWEMESKHVKRTVVTYVGALKACSILANIEYGKKVYESFSKSGIKENLILKNALVDMYAKCGYVHDARQAFADMSERDVISWNVLIAGYVQHGPLEEAFQLYERMDSEYLKPDKMTFLSVLKACIKLGDLGRGKKIHAHIKRRGLETEIFVASTLVDMYAKCGSIEEAQEMFEKMQKRNEVSWNSIIAGHIQHGNLDLAFKLFCQMVESGINPVKVSFLSILRGCANLGDIDEGRYIHSLIIMNNFETDDFIGNSLVDMYAKCGDVDSGHVVFDGLTDQSLISWNALITGYVHQLCIETAFELFLDLLSVKIELNEVTFITIIKACISPEYLDDGRHIHFHIMECKLESFLYVGNSLIDMYSKCKSIEDAREVFEYMDKSDVVTWNVMIAGYITSGHGEEALKLFPQMTYKGLDPDEMTFLSLLKACGSLGSLKQGKGIHAIIKRHCLKLSAVLGNALVDMYAKCGSCEDARVIFENLVEREIVSWNTIITGYLQHGEAEQALNLFQDMKDKSQPDKITFVNAFKACGILGYLTKTKQIHDLAKSHKINFDPYLENTLIDAYGKCGDMKAAKQVFDDMEEHDIISWNALMSGHTQNGHVWETFECLHKMISEGRNPNHVTFVIILSVCNHAGLIGEGFFHFDAVNNIHGINYTQEHYACMVDLLCRIGLLQDATELSEKLPFRPTSVVWMILLGGCRLYSNLGQAMLAAEYIFELHPENSALYVLLSNICAMLVELEDVHHNIRDSFIGEQGNDFLIYDKTVREFVSIRFRLDRLCAKLAARDDCNCNYFWS